MASDMQRWNLFMPVELMEKTKNLAKKHHISSADVVRKALITYLAAVERAEVAKAPHKETADVA